jgi:hypothetical protein
MDGFERIARWRSKGKMEREYMYTLPFGAEAVRVQGIFEM